MGTHPIFESDFDCLTENFAKNPQKMATPKMVDVRELNPQQLTEVAQRYEQELQVLQGCHQELLAVRKKFITSREAVVESKDTAGEKLMVPLTGSLYVSGRFSDDEKLIVDIGTNFYVEKTRDEAIEFFDRKLKYVEENMDKIAPQVQQKESSRMMVQNQLVAKMKQAKLAKPTK